MKFQGFLIFINDNSSKIFFSSFDSIICYFLASDYLIFQNITDTEITFEGFLQYQRCYFKQTLFHLTNYTSSQGDFIRFTNLLLFESNYLINTNNGNICFIIIIFYWK